MIFLILDIFQPLIIAKEIENLRKRENNQKEKEYSKLNRKLQITNEIDSKDNSNKSEHVKKARIRTATGGFVREIMVYLTIIAFLGNGIFMINVFWMSK